MGGSNLAPVKLHWQPFHVKLCNGVDKDFQLGFVTNIGYCITEDCITNSITL